MEPLIFITFLITLILFKNHILSKYNDLIINNIMKNGILEETFLKGDIFYKSKVKQDNKISYFVYIRLENGQEIIVDNLDIYSCLNIADMTIFKQNNYIYKSYYYSFYTLHLDGLESIKLNEKIDYFD